MPCRSVHTGTSVNNTDVVVIILVNIPMLPNSHVYLDFRSDYNNIRHYIDTIVYNIVDNIPSLPGIYAITDLR